MGFAIKLIAAAIALAGVGIAPGCASAPTTTVSAVKVEPTVQQLNAGDVIKIAFPGADNLDTTQQIRRDGKVNLYMVGEVVAEGKTPSDLEKELIEAYASQLRSNEIKVTVVTSAFSVYVTGAVMRPGKITPERAITAFDAIMEAGGFDNTRANTKEVRVIRQIDGQIENHTINMKALLEGRQTQPFYLRSGDAVYVPEKFSWF